MSSFSSVDLPEPLSPTIATILPAGMLRLSFSSTGVRQPYRKRSEEHTSELQSRLHLVCRLLLEKKNKLHTPLTDPKCITQLVDQSGRSALTYLRLHQWRLKPTLSPLTDSPYDRVSTPVDASHGA